MKYCPTCRRYVNGALSCPGCAIDAGELPLAAEVAPPTRLLLLAASPPTAPPAPAPAPARTVAPERPARRVGLGRRLAPALLIAALGITGLHAAAASRDVAPPAVPGSSAHAGTGGADLPAAGSAPGWSAGQSLATVAITPDAPLAEASPVSPPTPTPTPTTTTEPTPTAPATAAADPSSPGPTPAPATVRDAPAPTPTGAGTAAAPPPASAAPPEVAVPPTPTPSVGALPPPPPTNCLVQLLFLCVG